MSTSLIFIAHDSREKKRAHELHDKLKLSGLNPWIDASGLRPGDHWDDEIKTKLSQTSYFLILLSQHSLDSNGYFIDEIRTALHYSNLEKNRKRLIPILLDSVKLPKVKFGASYLDQHQAIKLYQPKGLDQLIAFLKSENDKWVNPKLEILELIGSGKTEKAFEKAIDSSQNQPKQHEDFAQLQGRYFHLLRERNLNLLTTQEYFTNLAQINNSLINLTNTFWKNT